MKDQTPLKPVKPQSKPSLSKCGLTFREPTLVTNNMNFSLRLKKLRQACNLSSLVEIKTKHRRAQKEKYYCN